MSSGDRFTQNGDWREQSIKGQRDLVEPGCATCRVRMDVDICKRASLEHLSCPIARGRFWLVLRSAIKKIGAVMTKIRTKIDVKKAHLIGCVERYAIEEGKIAKAQMERMKVVKDLGELGRYAGTPGEDGTLPLESEVAPVRSTLQSELRQLDKQIRESSKDAGRFARECGVHAHSVKSKPDAFDRGVFGKNQ